MQIIQMLLWLFYGYILLGLILGSWFIFGRASKVDEDLKESKWYTRLLLLPGSIALWPLLIRKKVPTNSPES